MFEITSFSNIKNRQDPTKPMYSIVDENFDILSNFFIFEIKIWTILSKLFVVVHFRWLFIVSLILMEFVWYRTLYNKLSVLKFEFMNKYYRYNKYRVHFFDDRLNIIKNYSYLSKFGIVKSRHEIVYNTCKSWETARKHKM